MYRIFFIVLLIIANTSSVFSQKRILKNIEKENFLKAEKKINKKLTKSKDEYTTYYLFAKLYNAKKFKAKYNPDTAYYFIKIATEKYNALPPDKKKKVKVSFLLDSLINESNKICNNAFVIAKEHNTLYSYEHFMAYYKDNGDILLEKAEAKRDIVAYKIAEGKNDIESYQYFINTYPDAKQIKEAIKLRNLRAFEKAKNDNTIKVYDDFIKKYPNAQQIEEVIKLRNTKAFQNAEDINTVVSFQYFIKNYPNAIQKKQAILFRDKLAYKNAVLNNTSKAFNDFIKAYPNSHLNENAYFESDKLYYFENVIQNNIESHIDFLKNNEDNRYKIAIQDSLYYISKRNNSFIGFDYIIRNVNLENLQDSAWLYYYKISVSPEYPFLYQMFKNAHFEKFPFKELFNSEYKKVVKKGKFGLLKYFEEDLLTLYFAVIKIVPKDYISYDILQTLLSPYIKIKDWKNTIIEFNKIRVFFYDDNKLVNGLEKILTSTDKSVKSYSISKLINTKGREYSPVISADNKSLYFCGKDRKDNIGGEDIFISKRRNGYWQKAKIVKELSTSYSNDAPESLSADGNQMFLFKNGDIYFSDKKKIGWTKPEKLYKTINTDEWEADAMITSDRKAILFVSARAGGQNITDTGSVYSRADIYVCINKGNQWGKAINLGSIINTPQSERSPFLHPDMKTLYFSSEGHGGLGDLDVYKTTRLNDSWTEWSEPENLGKEINTIGKDWGYKISTDGKKAYYTATATNGSDDIYIMNLPIHLRPGYVATVSGKLLDSNNNPIDALIKWEDLETGEIIGESKSNPLDGSYFIVLPLGKNYGYFIEKKNFFPISDNIDLRRTKKPVVVEKNISMITIPEMIKQEKAVTAKNLFFNSGKDELLSSSIPELNRIAKIIKEYSLKTEISGHTDNVGETDYNQELSERRSISVKNYLIKLGCKESLLIAKGYGETKPIDTNNNKIGQSKNRRVEIRFIK